MSRRHVRTAVVLAATGVLTGVTAAQPAAFAATHRPAAARHVLLVSVDGLHQSDLAWYTAGHPKSALAQLVGGGVEYTHARTTTPSDSFPGMVAQATGGSPGTTGVYYDDTYNAALLPAGTTSCKGVKPGVEVDLTEDLDKNQASIDAGQGLAGLPDSILSMTGHPQSLINASKLPVDPKTCKPVSPHSYLKVNTIFEVARQAGLRTAWSDKHAAYEILNGPSGTGVQDLFTPEINSDALGYAARQRLDHGQQGHRAVRRLQGEGRPQRDRRLRPQRHPQGRHPGDLRPQLPVGLHRAEAARLGRPHRRLHRQERPGPAAGEEPGLRQHGDRRPDRRDRQATPLRQHHRHPLRQARPVAHRPRRAHPRRRRPAP